MTSDRHVKMRDMNAQMRLPNVQDFATINGAAAMLGVAPITVKRYLGAGTLTPYYPRGASTRDFREALCATQEVETLARARKIMGRA